MEVRDDNGTPIRLEGERLYFGDESIAIEDVGIVNAAPRDFFGQSGDSRTDLTVQRIEGPPFIQTVMSNNQDAVALSKAIGEASMRKYNEQQGLEG